ncbi:hypothetical protein KY359_00950 [Candidatus Woesearchaeota archaeon]|nr:hypothetical protein [Candidatus Woesearchaeota archaeon]
MKKAGDKAKSFAAHAFFILIVVVGLYFIVTSSVQLTGYAVLDASTAKSKLESALASSAMFSQLPQASMCVVINDPEQPLSLQAVKSSAGWTVSEMKGFCTGQTSEDVIVQFPDYDSFSQVVDNPSPRAIATAAVNQDFQILPSRYVQLGGNVVCDAAFKVKYCPALMSTASPEQLIDGDLTCCLDKLTSSQKKLLEQHLQEGTYQDEMGVLEQAGGIAGMSMTTSIIILSVILLVVVGIVAGVMMHHGKGAPEKAPAAGPSMPGMPGAGAPSTPSASPGAMAMPDISGMGMAAQAQPTPTESPQITELRNYVAQALGEGYETEEVRSHLLEIGWDYQTADRILGEAQAMLQQQQQ